MQNARKRIISGRSSREMSPEESGSSHNLGRRRYATEDRHRSLDRRRDHPSPSHSHREHSSHHHRDLSSHSRHHRSHKRHDRSRSRQRQDRSRSRQRRDRSRSRHRRDRSRQRRDRSRSRKRRDRNHSSHSQDHSSGERTYNIHMDTSRGYSHHREDHTCRKRTYTRHGDTSSDDSHPRQDLLGITVHSDDHSRLDVSDYTSGGSRRRQNYSYQDTSRDRNRIRQEDSGRNDNADCIPSYSHSEGRDRQDCAPDHVNNMKDLSLAKNKREENSQSRGLGTSSDYENVSDDENWHPPPLVDTKESHPKCDLPDEIDLDFDDTPSIPYHIQALLRKPYEDSQKVESSKMELPEFIDLNDDEELNISSHFHSAELGGSHIIAAKLSSDQSRESLCRQQEHSRKSKWHLPEVIDFMEDEENTPSHPTSTAESHTAAAKHPMLETKTCDTQQKSNAKNDSLHEPIESEPEEGEYFSASEGESETEHTKMPPPHPLNEERFYDIEENTNNNKPQPSSSLASGNVLAPEAEAIVDGKVDTLCSEGRSHKQNNLRERREAEFDMVVTRPSTNDGYYKKQGNMGDSRPVWLQSNYFKAETRPGWCMYQYKVDFTPDETESDIRKGILRNHHETLGAYIFDGDSLYLSYRLTANPLVLNSDIGKGPVMIKIRFVGDLAPTDVVYLHFYNILVRKCLNLMGLEEMGRHFFDRHQAIRLQAHGLELWPGYKTSMRNHENDILLGVEVVHKVLRLDNCLQVISNLLQRYGDGAEELQRIRNELVGSIVMTVYNRRTYRIDDIEWNSSPLSTFKLKTKDISFMQYFEEKYNLIIRDVKQPLLVSRPKRKDYRKGNTGPILLIPEFCQMTGLNEQMRSNHNLMKAIAQHLHTDPMKRSEKLLGFIRRLKSQPKIQEELDKWGLGFCDQLVEFEGRQFQKENILFGGQQHELPNERFDWSRAFRDKPMLSTVSLQTWAIIVPGRDAQCMEKLIRCMQRVASPMKFRIEFPVEIRRILEIRPNDYANAIDQLMNEHLGRLQLIFAILPRQVTDIYSAVKKRACIEFGVPSQCFVAKNVYNEKGLMSICTKLVVQMNAKLGGEPWTLSIPLDKLMIVGFDAYHSKAKKEAISVGAMVSTTCPSQAKYFSTVSRYLNRNNLSEVMGSDLTKCLMAFYEANQYLPERVIMYRDGVGDGQLKYVFDVELNAMKRTLESVYSKAGKSVPKFTFIVVSKKGNTRIFNMEFNGKPSNPGPGTVADDVITLPERYDFYLVSQFSRLGTVSTVSYNVLYDRQGLDASKIQRITYKLCHMYFNWSGTVSVPAPCQYAKKLAYMTSVTLGASSSVKLANSLYFL